MLVYGDRREQAEPDRLIRDINHRLDCIAAMPAGIERHSSLAGVFVDAGELLQGIADSAFAQAKLDRRDPRTEALSSSLVELAHAVCRSWDSGFGQLGPVPRLDGPFEWPSEIEIRVPEGYAFYAVYPEAYLEAARRLKLTAAPRVIGIRSIGTSLAAIVAAALDAAPPVTVRPFGDPFDRRIALDESLERELLDGDAHYIIVDEGPGQSGSSFAAVADWLLERGVPLDRIALLPSHAGAPGPQSTQERRQLWNEVQRQVGDFGDRWPELVASWCGAAIGELDEAPEDISGGGWRRLHWSSEDEWPAVVPAWERRKFLLRSRGEMFVAKFAGLGRIGDEKLAIAGTLRCEGLVPEPIALAHGFLVERWYEDAAPLGRSEQPLREIGRYVGTRARLLPAPSGSGASTDELLCMARRNVSLEFGDEATHALEQWESRAADLERRIVRVRTDNRLNRHEWLRTERGGLIKTDALDHHQGHDLIGCQDIAWDAAGALVEFAVPDERSGELVEAIEHWFGGEVDRELLDFYRLGYLAFRLGSIRLGASMVADRSERDRLAARASLYAAELQHLLEHSTRATRPESLVG
jgi:hypothetical protein